MNCPPLPDSFAAKLSVTRMLVKNASGRAAMTPDVTNDTGARIGELVRQRQAGLSPAEGKLARVRLGSYPIPGLGRAAPFAQRGRVSAPTVTRLITQLGFPGHPGVPEPP